MSNIESVLESVAELKRNVSPEEFESLIMKLASSINRSLGPIPMAELNIRARLDCLIMEAAYPSELSRENRTTIITMVHYQGRKTDQQQRIARGGMHQANGRAKMLYNSMTPEARLQRANYLKAVYDDSIRSDPPRPLPNDK